MSFDRSLSAEPSAEPQGAPWYVQFWPLFIAGLMVVSIAASLVTVVIAHRHADEDVRFESGVAPGAEPVR